MDPSRWQQIEDVFHQAIELPDSSRSRFVERICHTAPEIKDEVISLLEHHIDDSEFLEHSPVSIIGPELNVVAVSFVSEMSESLPGTSVNGFQRRPRINEIDSRTLVESLRWLWRNDK